MAWKIFPDQGFNSCPLQWKGRVLTTGPPGLCLCHAVPSGLGTLPIFTDPKTIGPLRSNQRASVDEDILSTRMFCIAVKSSDIEFGLKGRTNRLSGTYGTWRGPLKAKELRASMSPWLEHRGNCRKSTGLETWPSSELLWVCARDSTVDGRQRLNFDQ